MCRCLVTQVSWNRLLKIFWSINDILGIRNRPSSSRCASSCFCQNWKENQPERPNAGLSLRLKTVSKAIKEIKMREIKIDILVLNAGLYYYEPTECLYNINSIQVVNHYSHFYLLHEKQSRGIITRNAAKQKWKSRGRKISTKRKKNSGICRSSLSKKTVKTEFFNKKISAPNWIMKYYRDFCCIFQWSLECFFQSEIFENKLMFFIFLF